MLGERNVVAHRATGPFAARLHPVAACGGERILSVRWRRTPGRGLAARAAQSAPRRLAGVGANAVFSKSTRTTNGAAVYQRPASTRWAGGRANYQQGPDQAATALVLRRVSPLEFAAMDGLAQSYDRGSRGTRDRAKANIEALCVAKGNAHDRAAPRDRARAGRFATIPTSRSCTALRAVDKHLDFHGVPGPSSCSRTPALSSGTTSAKAGRATSRFRNRITIT